MPSRKQNRAICPVSFDLDDAHEAELHKFATSKKFSPYMKRLIWIELLKAQEEEMGRTVLTFNSRV